MDWLANFEGMVWKTMAMSYGLKLVGGLVLFLVGLQLARWIAGLAEKGLTRVDVEPTAVMFLRKVAYVILLVVLILAVLQVFGVR